RRRPRRGAHRRGESGPPDGVPGWRIAPNGTGRIQLLTPDNCDIQNGRGMARGNQLDRQWRLLQLIDRPAGVTVEDAARALDCHVRTIWRDVDVLAGAGFPIYDEKAGDSHRTVWRVTEEFRRRLPLKLGLAEVLALLLSRDLLAAAGASVLGPDLA